MRFAYVVIFALLASSAQAQQPRFIGRSAPAAQGITNVLTKLEAVQVADLTMALAYAQAQNDKAAVTCYTTWLATLQQLARVREENPPGDGPSIVTAFQKARNLVKMMDTDSPFRMDCAALAQDAKKDVRSFISDIVTGVALKALTGGLIP